MNSPAQLAAEIETQFWGELKPDDFLEDVKKVFDRGRVTEQFVVDLLVFTEAIDGYAGTARALPALEAERLKDFSKYIVTLPRRFSNATRSM